MKYELKDWKIAGFLLSVALLGLLFYIIDFKEALEAFRNVRPFELTIVFFLNFVVILFKSMRWRTLLTPKPRLIVLFLANLVGFMANTLLPARAGELVRALVLGKKENISKTTVIGSAALDRLFEGIGMLILLAIIPLIMETPDWMKKGTFGFIIFFSIAFALIILMMKLNPETFAKYIPFSENTNEIIKNIFEKLQKGFEAINNFKTSSIATIFSLMGWITQIFMVHFVILSFGIHLTPLAALMTLLAVNIAIMIPAAPGSLGTFELSVVLALGFFGIEKSIALSIALTYHFIQLIPVTIAGIISIPLLGMSFKDIDTRITSTNE
ncbi:MAG: flippase-like domain-containing protein [Deltaproteobacteria bacterium]|nr:flippase-like domain-containing protein [Deltaproteobacteria bacterium]